MGTKPRQLLLVEDGERAPLPLEVARSAVTKMGRLLLQRLRIEEERRKGERDDQGS